MCHGMFNTELAIFSISLNTPTSSFCVLVLVNPKHWSTDWPHEYYLGELIKNRVLASTVICWIRISQSRAQESKFLTNFPGDPNTPLDLGSTVLYGQMAPASTWLSNPKIECHHVGNTQRALEQTLLIHWKGKNLLSSCVSAYVLSSLSSSATILWLKHSAFPFLGREPSSGSLCFPWRIFLVVALEFFTFIIDLMHWCWAVGITFSSSV